MSNTIQPLLQCTCGLPLASTPTGIKPCAVCLLRARQEGRIEEGERWITDLRARGLIDKPELMKYHIELLNIDVDIPAGWRVVTDGERQTGDLAYSSSEHKFVATDPVTQGATAFYCLIRKVAT